MLFSDLQALSAQTSALDTQMRQIEAMYDQQQHKYKCEVCNKPYKTKGGIKKHLKNQHQWDLADDNTETCTFYQGSHCTLQIIIYEMCTSVKGHK